jgi:hypothetical protein
VEQLLDVQILVLGQALWELERGARLIIQKWTLLSAGINQQKQHALEVAVGKIIVGLVLRQAQDGANMGLWLHAVD